MKKFTFLIVALLVAAMGFAQTKQLVKPTFKAKTTVATRNTRAVTGTLKLCGDMSEDNAIGTGEAGTLSAAVRFEANDLTSYVGQYITKISVGVADASVISSAKVAILTGTIDAPSIVMQQACTFADGINDIELNVPYQIPASTAIMIAYEMVVTSGYPMGVDDGPAVTNGDLLCIGSLGTALVSMNDAYDLDYNNIITATVEDEISTGPVMMVSPNAMSFSGYVGDANTASKAATVVAAALTGNINITTAAPFEVSSDNTTFGTSATMTGAGTFYVRYIPANAEALNVTGTVTVASTGAESQTIALTANTYDCSNAITIPYVENFASMSGCWTMVSNNPENTTGTYAYGPYDLNGEMVFRFSSYNEAENEDYNQFLITPELSLPNGAVLSFDYAGEDEEFRIMVSSTNNDIASFTALGDDMVAESDDFTAYITTIPAGTKYIAINYFSDYLYFLYVDNFSLTEIPTNPEIALTSVTPATGTTIIGGSNVTISGVVTNNGVALTSYKVSYTVDGGEAVEYTVSEINVALGETHNFTHATPIVINEAGTHTIVVSVSEPNGVADGDDTDNSQTITLNVITCDPITELPYTQTFDAITECWGTISNNTANDVASGKMGLYDLNGNSVFRFSSYSSADDYNQYLITPQLGYSTGVKLSFDYAKSNSADEVFKVLVSSTDNNIASFSALSNEVTVTSTEMTPFEIVIPSGTKYVAINYYSSYKYYMYVDNLTFSELVANEIELAGINLNEESGCGLNTITPVATIANGGTNEISSFTLSYTVNEGEAVNATVTPENPIASGATYQYTFPNAINISELGTYTIAVTIAMEGDADDTNNAASASISNLAPEPVPYENELANENDILGFHFIDGNNDGTVWALDEGTLTIAASEANDYAITSCISIAEAGDYIFDFDYAGGYYDDSWASWGLIFDNKENFQIVYGTAPTAEAMTNVIATYTDVYEENLVNARRGFSIAAAGTYYFGILCNSTEGDHLTIDNISIYAAPTTPEIALTSVAPATGASVQLGQSVNISGVVTNNGVTLTSYKVAYTVDGGDAVEYTVNGINVALGETNSFNHTTPITFETAGEHTIVVTVSEPNGVADGNANDNSKTITINAIDCGGPITTFPYVESFEGGIPPCWTKIDNDGDGYNWMTLAETNEAFATGYAHEGDGAAVSWSYYPETQSSNGWSGPSLNADDYLITNAFTLPANETYELSFYVASLNGSSYPDDIEVKISTTGMNVSDFTTLIAKQTITTSLPDYEEKTASLANYAGQTVYIAFVHNSSDQFGIIIDDVKIALPTSAEENIVEAIAVYPNPTSNMVTIANAEGKDIIVVNSLGQVVASIENAAANQTIDVSNFANGTYFVKVDAEVVKLNVVK